MEDRKSLPCHFRLRSLYWIDIDYWGFVSSVLKDGAVSMINDFMFKCYNGYVFGKRKKRFSIKNMIKPAPRKCSFFLFFSFISSLLGVPGLLLKNECIFILPVVVFKIDD